MFAAQRTVPRRMKIEPVKPLNSVWKHRRYALGIGFAGDLNHFNECIYVSIKHEET
jgi:hypothetical protein